VMQNNLSPASVATEARARGDQLGGDHSEDNATGPANQAQLISAIRAHIARADRAAEKAEQHFVAAGLYLKRLKDTAASWAEWEALLKTRISISAGRASELMQIADGRKTAEGLAIASAERSKKHRSSLRNEEVRLEKAIDTFAAALKEMGADKRASVLARVLDPIGMVAAPAKAGNGLCRWVKDDGGRSHSKLAHADRRKVSAGDCVTRAIAIAAEKKYDEVHEALTVRSVRHIYSLPKRTMRGGGVCVFDPDHGCSQEAYGGYLKSLGWTRVPTKDTHLRADELPPGRLVVEVSRHLVAVIDGVIHDTFDCAKSGRRQVQGYWRAAS